MNQIFFFKKKCHGINWFKQSLISLQLLMRVLLDFASHSNMRVLTSLAFIWFFEYLRVLE
jgi:hypothetical protein